MSGVQSGKMDHSADTEVLYGASMKSLSSELPSIDSSLIFFESEDSAKMKLYKKGLYSPGSGEICAKYVTLSRSSVLRHSYYNYPSLLDPGIERALLFPEEEKMYDDDGQELYLDLCKQMNVIPVRSFYRDLKKSVINLRYYGVNPVGVRAMCMALAYNKTVKRLDLTSNCLDYGDACYHLGQLLGDRNALQELVLAGCNIGHNGIKKLVVYLYLRKLNLLDLSANNIQDVGFAYIAHEIQEGAVIRKLNLRRNELTSDSLMLLAESIEFNDTITHLDLSWNRFMKQKGQSTLLHQLSTSEVLVELNMAWTSLSVVVELKDLFGIPTLKVLDLSNNKLSSASARIIAKSLYMANSLEVLDLSCNPFSPSDALYLLIRMRHKRVNLRELRMDHIIVSKEFVIELKEIMKLNFRRNAVITHGDILRNYSLPEFDIKVITMRRIVKTMKKKRGNKLDILAYLLETNKTCKFLDPSDLIRTLNIYGVPVNDAYINDLTKLFPGPKTDNGNRTINLNFVVDYIHRIWPDKQLPPTPPPTPPPASLPPIPKKGTGKKKK